MELNEKIVNLLIDKKYTIAFAESCTGGLCASKIVEVSNASKVLNESIITYSNESKVKYLGVQESTIMNYGVVSEQVTKEMALGIAKQANAKIGVSISGIAGPTGGTKNKPVGMVCFGISINNEVYTFTNCFGDIGRNNVREKSVEFIFNKLIELI